MGPKSALFLITILAMASCRPGSDAGKPTLATYFKPVASPPLSGGVQLIPIETPKGAFRVWTKRFGNHPKVKLLLLNGGPGATHEYFECFESFLPAEGIEFIYYDQLGCGHSDNPGDTSLWDLPRYVEEVEQVRTALGLDSSNFFLLGHSWGGILAMEYALKYQRHLKGLVISNMMSSCPDYGRYADEVLARQMDPAILDTIRRIEAAEDFSNPKYMQLLMPNFYAKHILRMPLEAWPEPVNRSFAKMNQSLYITMQGPSEFGIAGKLTLLGSEVRSQDPHRSHLDHRRDARHDGPRSYGMDVEGGSERTLPALSEWWAYVHVGRPGRLHERADIFFTTL